MSDNDSPDFSADNLPDDLKLWPKDSLVWFGLSEDSTPKDLRKAYSRLIKRFRPEIFPDQFERIQQEYEILQRRYESSESFVHSAEGADSSDDDSILQKLKKLLENMNPEDISPEEKQRQEEIERFIDLAFLKIDQQDWQGARAQFKNALTDSYYGEIPALYLFWMEYVNPEETTAVDEQDVLPEKLQTYLAEALDYLIKDNRKSEEEDIDDETEGEAESETESEQNANKDSVELNAITDETLEKLENMRHELYMVDWLIQGICAAKTSDDDLSTSLKMLATWLQQQMFPSSYPLFRFIIDNIPNKGLTIVLNIKWNYLESEDGNLSDVVKGDLDQIRSRVSSESPIDWLLILIEAQEHVLWQSNEESQELVQTLYTEINQYSELHDKVEHGLDNLDRLESIIQSWQSIPEVLPLDKDMLRNVLFGSGNMPFTIYRRCLLHLIAPLTCDVIKLLLVFDYLAYHHSIVLDQLRMPLLQLFRSRHPELTQCDPETFPEIVDKLFAIWVKNNREYDRCRLEYLAFFLQEQLFIHPFFDYLILQINKFGPETDSGATHDTNSEDGAVETSGEDFKLFADKILSDLPVALAYYAIVGSDTN